MYTRAFTILATRRVVKHARNLRGSAPPSGSLLARFSAQDSYNSER